MTVISVTIYLLCRAVLHVTYSQYMKDIRMSIGSVTMERFVKILSLGI